MKLITIAIIAFCLCAVSSSYAQNSYTIKGAAVDTDLRIKLYNTTISVLNAKDSILQKFTRATDNGSFSLSGLPTGKFILLVTYPEYADYVEPFTIDPAHPTHDFGNISLRQKIKILQEVLIKGEVRAIKIKGDTTEFNAKAYTIQPNDKVEDLLKQLPGITIDKDGKITANGEAVTKVLVDGEEFFGDDPTLVTKNLRADMVSTVQLFDKKSDQAAFTGIDDGVKTKTINIKLKEDKKNGIFGKVDAGVGTDGYYTGQLIFNKFKAKE
ncbi:MAG TPA: TonB-dependent receptor, partial [Mucilaginibacter sp.]